MATCKICGTKIVEPIGPIGHILIAGDYPGIEDIRRGVPMCGTPGAIVRGEMARAGISIDMCRTSNLWLHAMTPSMLDEAGHFDWHLGKLIDEIGMAQHVFLMGSELSQVFLKRGITDICGLEFGSPYFPTGRKATFATNPAQLLHSTVGEFRLACQKFSGRVNASRG